MLENGFYNHFLKNINKRRIEVDLADFGRN